jgi:hypothetical protein
MRRLTLGTTTLTTPLNILKTNCTNMLIVQTNVHQLTANSPIIHTPRNTVKKPHSALNTHKNLHTLATIPLDHMKTHKMEFDMLNTDRNVAKEYEEYVKYEEHKEIDEEFNAPRNTVKKPQPALNAHEDLPTVATAPLDQVETHKTEFAMFNTEGDIAKVYVEYEEYEEYNEEFNTDRSLFRGYHNRMDEEELRYQLLDSINGPLEDAMYEASGSKIYTIP